MIKVYLIYSDKDPNERLYRETIADTKIITLRCCNNDCKNLLRSNKYGLKVEKLPVFICRQNEERWILPWSELELVKILASMQE